MTGPPLVAGPATSTPPRSPGSVRRTTSIDTLRPDGPHGALVVDARGRDLGTGRDTANPADVRREVALTLRLEAASHSQVGRPGPRSRGRPPRPSAADRRPGRFRLPPRGGQDPAGRARPQHDLPSLARRPRGRGAGSGYALLHADALPPQPGMVDAAVARLGDQCAGWALDWRLHRQPEGHRPPRHAPRTCGTAPRVARRRPPGLARHGATPARCHAPAPPARRTGARVRWPARHRRALSRQPRGRGGPRDRGPRVCRRRIDRRAPPPDRRPVGQGPRAAVGGMPGGRRQRRTVAGHDLR